MRYSRRRFNERQLCTITMKYVRTCRNCGRTRDYARGRGGRTHPNATSTEIVGKIIHLRQNYHFGPAKIQMYLKRYHDVEVSKSGVWRILKRLNMNRLPASQRYKRHDRRWKRYEKQQPGHRVQIDVKFIEPLDTHLVPRPPLTLRWWLGGASTTSTPRSTTGLPRVRLTPDL